MGKKSRTKGAAYENEVCKALYAIFPDAKRNLAQYQGADGRDLDGTQRICMQLKRRKKITLAEIKVGFIEAVESTDDEYEFPALLWRDDGGVSKIMFNLDDWVEISCALEDGEF